MRAAGFEPGDPVIALDFMPGLVYAVGGRSPGFPFYVFDKPEQNCWAIERIDRPTSVPFLLLGQDMLVEQHACIHAFAFPEEFRFVAAAAQSLRGADPVLLRRAADAVPAGLRAGRGTAE